MPIGRSPALSGAAHLFRENSRPGVGRRRRLSPMELQLPQLRGLPGGHLARAGAHAILHRRQPAGSGPLGARERLAGYPGAIAGESRSAAEPRPARQRALRHRPGRRAGRSHHRTLHAARIDPSLADLVHRQHLCGSDPRQSRARGAGPFLRHRSAPHRARPAGFTVDEVPDVRWRALPVASKPAPYSPNRDSPVPGDNVALVIEDGRSGRSAVYAPGLGAIDERLWRSHAVGRLRAGRRHVLERR